MVCEGKLNSDLTRFRNNSGTLRMPKLPASMTTSRLGDRDQDSHMQKIFNIFQVRRSMVKSGLLHGKNAYVL
jgi:hypothetical protein